MHCCCRARRRLRIMSLVAARILVMVRPELAPLQNTLCNIRSVSALGQITTTRLALEAGACPQTPRVDGALIDETHDSPLALRPQIGLVL